MIRSSKERLLWAQFDALQLGSGWDEEDIESRRYWSRMCLGTAIRAVSI